MHRRWLSVVAIYTLRWDGGTQRDSRQVDVRGSLSWWEISLFIFLDCDLRGGAFSVPFLTPISLRKREREIFRTRRRRAVAERVRIFRALQPNVSAI